MLRSLRRAQDLTQQQVAAALGIKPQSYFKYEKGIVIPPADKLLRLSMLFNVTVDYLLRDLPAGETQSAVESGPLATAMRAECEAAFATALAKADRDVGKINKLLGAIKRLRLD